MKRKRPVIAIDGPAGAGKSTAARRLAQALGYLLLDTGALYRGIALLARERGVSWDNGAALGELASSTSLTFARGADGTPRLMVDGVDRADEIRTPEIAMGASHVSRHPDVRQALLGIQRALGRQGGVVVEGRDIGTVVFPDAEAKVYLTASAETRAGRRLRELQARGEAVNLEDTLREVRQRDQQDQGRETAPLKPAADSILFDTTGLSLEQVVARLLAIAHEVAPESDAEPG